jgi:hypothetical protein
MTLLTPASFKKAREFRKTSFAASTLIETLSTSRPEFSGNGFIATRQPGNVAGAAIDHWEGN